MKTIVRKFVVKPMLLMFTILGGLEFATVLYDRAIAKPLGLEPIRVKLTRATRKLEAVKR